MVPTDETAANDLVLVLNWMDELAAADDAAADDAEALRTRIPRRLTTVERTPR